MVINKVLVPVDGSENSDRALDFALEFAEKFSASITILNVSELLPIGLVPDEPIAYATATTGAFGKDLQRIHSEILSKSVARAKAS